MMQHRLVGSAGTTRWGSMAASVGSTILLALAPKCPLCIAAALSSVGLGAAAASAVGLLVRPFAIAFAVLAVAALVAGERRRSRARRAARPCCAR